MTHPDDTTPDTTAEPAGAAPSPESPRPSGRKWAFAAFAALALALLTFPMLLSQQGDGVIANVADVDPPDDATCTGNGTANYDFTLHGPGGETVRLADYEGKVVLLNFWGTWCPPCRVEVPAFVDVQEAYRDRGFVIIGVAVEDTAEAVKSFASEMKINYPIAMSQENFENAYGPIYGLPLSYFIARDGSICRKHFGELTKERVEREIAGLL